MTVYEQTHCNVTTFSSVPFFGFGTVEYSPSSITTTEFDTTPNYSTATGNLSLEDDYTSNVLISTPMVISSSIDNDVEMVADSLSTSVDEALENLKVSLLFSTTKLQNFQILNNMYIGKQSTRRQHRTTRRFETTAFG